MLTKIRRSYLMFRIWLNERRLDHIVAQMNRLGGTADRIEYATDDLEAQVFKIDFASGNRPWTQK